jgi:hypothetical protein
MDGTQLARLREEELETRARKLERHCGELLAYGASVEQLQAVIRARRAVERELRLLRGHQMAGLAPDEAC